MYSVLDVTEDVVEPFSQSFSPFLLLERLGDRKPSAESGLGPKHKSTNTQGIRSPPRMGAASENSAITQWAAAGKHYSSIQAKRKR